MGSKLDCIESVEVAMVKDEKGNKTDKSKGYGFVIVGDEDSADKIAFMGNYEFNGRKIEVKKSVPSGSDGGSGRGCGGSGGYGGGMGEVDMEGYGYGSMYGYEPVGY